MSEYTEVEKPFLQQLEAHGWTAIDQGPDKDSVVSILETAHREGVRAVKKHLEHDRS